MIWNDFYKVRHLVEGLLMKLGVTEAAVWEVVSLLHDGAIPAASIHVLVYFSGNLLFN
jgi:hypothetical protein